MIEILTNAEMAEADRLTIAGGVAGLTLMENAGSAVAETVAARLPVGSRVAILAGPGSAGGRSGSAERHQWQFRRCDGSCRQGRADGYVFSQEAGPSPDAGSRLLRGDVGCPDRHCRQRAEADRPTHIRERSRTVAP